MNTNRKISLEDARLVGTELGLDWIKIPLEQFWRGLVVELGHSEHDRETTVTNDDLLLIGKIAWAHLKEMPDYYTRLDRLESEALGQTL